MPEVTDLKEAHKIAQSDGGPKTDRSAVSRGKIPEEGKMENELELNKANKRKTSKPEEVAGRQHKSGVGNKIFDKLTGDPKKKGGLEKK